MWVAFDWHGAVSQYDLRRASRQAGPDPGNKKNAQPRLFEDSFITARWVFLHFFTNSDPYSHETERVRRKLESAITTIIMEEKKKKFSKCASGCMRVCVWVWGAELLTPAVWATRMKKGKLFLLTVWKAEREWGYESKLSGSDLGSRLLWNKEEEAGGAGITRVNVWD